MARLRSPLFVQLALCVALALVLAQCALAKKLQSPALPPAKECSPPTSCFLDVDGVEQCYPCKKPTGVCDFNWFKPDDLTLNLGVVWVRPGTKCSWTWRQDAVGHCVTPGSENPPDWKGKNAGSDQESLGGYIYNRTFEEEGVYKYKCCTHLAGMLGTIVVSEDAPSPGPTTSPPPPKVVKSPPPKVVKSPPPKVVKSPPPKVVKSPPPKVVKSPPPVAVKSPPPPKPVKSPPPKVKSPPPKVVTKSPPPPKTTKTPPPSVIPPPPCTPSCQRRCYGKNGCGAFCPFPPDNTVAKCNTCCKTLRPRGTTTGTVNKCIANCRK